MSISRHSEPRTILLWGDRWWLPGPGASLDFTGLRHAAEVLAAHYADEPKPARLRLIFQPDSLQTVEAPCPNGRRATLAAALAGEFPALGESDHAWAFEPVLETGDRFSTWIHFEDKPGLFQLVDRLAQTGLIVESAWPLAAWLCALPTEWSELGGVTVVAAGTNRALAYHHPADQGRTIQSWSGDTAGSQLAVWLAAEMARCPGQPVFIVGGEEGGTDAIPPGTEHLTFAEALALPAVFPKKHPAQLLPPVPVVTVQHFALAASIAFLLIGSWSGFAYARQHVAGRDQAQASAAEKQVLQAEIARCRANAPEIAMLKASLAGPGSSPPATEFLEKLGRTIPREIALRSVHIEQGRFTLEGHVAPGTQPEALASWRTRLAAPHWSFDAPTPVSATGEFSVTGAFAP